KFSDDSAVVGLITDEGRQRVQRTYSELCGLVSCGTTSRSATGCPLDSVEVVGNGRMMAKLSSLLNNTSHPLQDTDSSGQLL
ncbi:hypothetical protein L3Q82_011053, partial [Scortum barcoo]